jgi:nucleoside-diphosphate-sugar epimerase
MKMLILGCGNAGMELAAQAKAAGWEVVGSTTTPARVDEIEKVADSAVVLVGSDSAAVAAAAADCDAIVVAVSPPAVRSAKKEDRGPIYEEVLVKSGRSAAAACDRVVFMSSISVYGDGSQESGSLLTEDTPRALDNGEPSTTFFAAGEDTVLAIPGGTVLRFPDMYGHPDDIEFADRVKLAHDHMGGSVPFHRDDRYHPIHIEDVAAATLFVLDHDLTGAYNVVPDEEPAPTVGDFWDRTADASGQARLEFRGEIRTPRQQTSSARLREHGFAFKHPVSEVV